MSVSMVLFMFPGLHEQDLSTIQKGGMTHVL